MAGKDFKNVSVAIMSIQDINETDLLGLLDAMTWLKNKKKETAFLEQALRKKSVSSGTLVRFADILFDAGQSLKALEYYRQATTAKTGLERKDGTAGDVEWAHYRIAVIAKGREGDDSLQAIQTANNTTGRFAAAALKGAELRRKVE